MTLNECLASIRPLPQTTNQHKALVIIPAYNEGAGIAEVLEALTGIAERIPLHTVLIDDGSTDRTAVQAALFLDRIELDIINHPTNQGVPRTFYDGLSAAAALADPDDCIVLIEGDGTSDLGILPAAVEAVHQGADIVIGSRQVAGGGYRGFPRHRALGSQMTNVLLRRGLRVPNVSDYTIFYRAYKAGLVQRVLREHGSGLLTSNSFAANVELLLRLAPHAKAIVEIPLEYDYGRKKSSSKMRLRKTLIECGGLIWKRWTGRI